MASLKFPIKHRLQRLNGYQNFCQYRRKQRLSERTRRSLLFCFLRLCQRQRLVFYHQRKLDKGGLGLQRLHPRIRSLSFFLRLMCRSDQRVLHFLLFWRHPRHNQRLSRLLQMQSGLLPNNRDRQLPKLRLPVRNLHPVSF